LAKPDLHIISHSPHETQQLGQQIGRAAQPGDIVLLSGPLGAGKTCLAQGIALGLGVSESTASPSYVLLREYAGRLPLYHVDLYRLEFDEIGEMGLDDYLYGSGVSVIEWAEKGMQLMPDEHLLIRLAYAGENQRSMEVVARGERYRRMANELAPIQRQNEKACS
jgi:tRNA threonylcarbamoyladenosine biosynthesis protein TsaE